MTSPDAGLVVVHTPEIPELRKIRDGKVRSLFDFDPGLLLFVASDRISARDRVLQPGVPMKGVVLNTMSTFFFMRTRGLAPNHTVPLRDLSTIQRRRLDELHKEYSWLDGRTMVVRAGEILPIEFIFRVQATGSFYKAYIQEGGLENGAVVLGHECPPGMKDGHMFPKPIFTPSTKAPLGEHDVNLTEEEAIAHLVEKAGVSESRSRELIGWGKERGLALTRYGAQHASDRNFLLADHKLEVVIIDGEPTIADELFTPDSSRFLDKAEFTRGRIVNFDKEPVRAWLDENWDGKGDPPDLPPEVVAATSKRYQEVGRILMY